MANFSGTWVTSGAMDGFDQFMDALGMSEMKEKYRNAISTINFNVKENQITFTESTKFTSGEEENIDYGNIEFGKEREVDGPNGSKVKLTLKKISDNEIHENEKTNYGDGNWREFLIKREVKGDNMDVEVTAVVEKVSMNAHMKRK